MSDCEDTLVAQQRSGVVLQQRRECLRAAQQDLRRGRERARDRHGHRKEPRFGSPDPEKINTSYVERNNLTIRMGMRRFTRKKIDNHVAALSLHFMHYNFCREHMTLKTTPAVAAGVADKIWKLKTSSRCTMGIGASGTRSTTRRNTRRRGR